MKSPFATHASIRAVIYVSFRVSAILLPFSPLPSEKANPIRGSVLTWDDICGFDGKISFFNNQSLGGKNSENRHAEQPLGRSGAPFELA
jgi:hypothetical protein